MDLKGNVAELQHVADYREVRKTVRAAGIGSVFFGILAIGVGGALLSESILNFLLILIGLFLLVVGIVNLILPTAEGIIVDGIGLVIVGLWNCFVSVLNIVAAIANQVPEETRGSFWAVMGIFQIAWGIHCFTRYRRYSEAFRDKPNDEDLKRMDKLAKTIQKADAKKSEDILAFRTKGFLQELEWKGQLSKQAAVFVNATRNRVLVASPDEVEFEPKGKVLLGKTLKASFRIRDETFSGLISPNSYEKYKVWKQGDDLPVAEAVE